MCSLLRCRTQCAVKPCSSWLHGKQKLLMTVPYKNCSSSWTVRSVLGNRNFSTNDNGATDPARVLLERWFTQTQKLEKMASDSFMPTDSQIGLHIGTFETVLQAVLSALKKKEEDLEDAERKVLSEQHKIDSAKEELVRREQEIASACFKQEKLEEELKLANLQLASQASEIDDLKLQIEDREKEIRDAHSKLALIDDDINRMKSELTIKSELAAVTESDLEEKASLLNEACEIVKKQEVEIQQVRKAVQEKEDDLKIFASLRELEEEKLKAAENRLKKRTTELLIAQDELKKLAEAYKRSVEVNVTAESFQRVKQLLSDVKSELLLSQKALCSSRQKMEDRGLRLQKQLMELEEEKKSLGSYMTSLKDTLVEVDSERVMLRIAEDRNEDLERDLMVEKELIAQLQAERASEKSSREKEISEKSFLQDQLERESTKLGEAQSLIQVKESELVEARQEIQWLKSEHDSLNFILEERYSELCDAKIKLEDVNKEIVDLKALMSNREDQLMQTENMLKEKEKHVQTMQLELNDTILRSSEAETVVERILELTKKLVHTMDVDRYVGSSPLLKDVAGDSKWEKKHLENELEIARESLRTKEIEVVAAQGALTTKEEELKQVHEAAIEKLQIEVAQLEAEAATTALYKLIEMSRELLSNANLSSDFDLNSGGLLLNSIELGRCDVDNKCLSKFKTEISRLSTLTEQLVKETDVHH